MVWGGVSQHHRTELVVIAGSLNVVRYREDILLAHVVPFQQALPDMTLQHDNATLLVLCDISCKTGMSVFCHGQRRARISIWDLLDQRVRARENSIMALGASYMLIDII